MKPDTEPWLFYCVQPGPLGKVSTVSSVPIPFVICFFYSSQCMSSARKIMFVRQTWLLFLIAQSHRAGMTVFRGPVNQARVDKMIWNDYGH